MQLTALAAGVTMVTLLTAGAAAQPGAQLPARDAAQRAAERIKTLQREADALATQESALLVQLRRFEVERQLRVEELGEIERERSGVEQSLADITTSAEALRRTAAAERPEIEGRLVRVYKLGPAGVGRILLDLDDLREAGRAYRTVAALTRIDRDRVAEHRRTLEAIGQQQGELEKRRTSIAGLQARALKARSLADQAVAERTALVAAIDARRDLNAQLTGELHSAQQRLQASVNQLGGAGTPVVLPLKAFRGVLPWPARGLLLARFGPAAGRRGAGPTSSTGVAIGLLEGQTVRAVHEGVVAYAASFAGYGYLVIVEHGDQTHSLYGYLASLAVSKGDRVEARSPVGASGLDPGGTAAVYFELRVDGQPVDPLQWLIRE